jgi:hypothetical protein
MKIAISQPTYLPWIGYFDLIDQVDEFVLLDDVQFEKQSWQQRNRIKTPAGLQWLTVPVIFRGRFGQLINQVEIRDAGFRRTHLRAVELNYRRARFFDRYFEELSFRMTCPKGNRLVDLNIGLIEWFMDVLGIRTPLLISSHLAQAGKRTELLANICNALGATQYVSPLGSAAYLLEQTDIPLGTSVELGFQQYEHPQYRQLFPPFCPQASALDLLFNEGEDSLQILRSGRRLPFSPAEVGGVVLAEARG